MEYQKESLESLETKLIARESVAGAASEAVQQVNQNERNEFLMSCNFHRQQLLDFYSWEFRNVRAIDVNYLEVLCFLILLDIFSLMMRLFFNILCLVGCIAGALYSAAASYNGEGTVFSGANY